MRPSVTVCMATHNGAKFLIDQVQSILDQLKQHDELIVIDDFSTDNSFAILSSFKDSRLKLFKQTTNCGHVRTFEKALYMAENEVILLADQDDVWLEGRLDLLTSELLSSDCFLVTSKYSLIDENGQILDEPPQLNRYVSSGWRIANIADIFLGRQAYFGCTMILKADLLKLALPIPNFVESHDIWLALAANIQAKNKHSEKITLHKRIHAKNLTPVKRRNAYKILMSRALLLLSVTCIVVRIWRSKMLRYS